MRESTRSLKSIGIMLCAMVWCFILFRFLDKTGLESELSDAFKPYQNSITGLVLTLFLLPVVYATARYIYADFKVPATVPATLRLSYAACQFLLRSMAFGSLVAIATTVGPLVPMNVTLWLVAISLAIAVVGAFLNVRRKRTATATVTKLYDAIRSGETDVRDSLCYLEAAENLDALDGGFGKLTWYRIRDLMLQERQFAFFVETIRDGLPKFEEIRISSDGRRVEQATAAGL